MYWFMYPSTTGRSHIYRLMDYSHHRHSLTYQSAIRFHAMARSQNTIEGYFSHKYCVRELNLLSWCDKCWCLHWDFRTVQLINACNRYRKWMIKTDAVHIRILILNELFDTEFKYSNGCFSWHTICLHWWSIYKRGNVAIEFIHYVKCF